MRSAIVVCLALLSASAEAADRDRDGERVQAIVERSSPRFAVCFGKHDVTLPDRMKVVVRLRIAPSGRVASVAVERDPHVRVTACVVSVARTLAFGPLPRAYDIRVPILFARD